MKKIYFIFGYYVSSWGEYGGSSSFQIKGIIEINQEDFIDIILESIVKMLTEKVASKKLEKHLQFGGSGDLGGSSTKFHFEFFCENGNTALIRKLNQHLETRLGEVFNLEYKSI